MSSPSLRLCFFGDSIVAGFGDETQLGWVGRVVHAARVTPGSDNFGGSGTARRRP